MRQLWPISRIQTPTAADQIYEAGGPTALFDAVRMGRIEPDDAADAMKRATSGLRAILKNEATRMMIYVFHDP